MDMTDPDVPQVSHPVTEDPPQPDLAELQQREVFEYPSVPVRLDGPASVSTLPNGRFSVSAEPLGDNAVRVLTNDPRRRRAVLVMYSATATDYWKVKSTASGQGVPWPANVPCVMDHCDEVWAQVGAGYLTLSVLIEHWAD
jgi:hypothetical protein